MWDRLFYGENGVWKGLLGYSETLHRHGGGRACHPCWQALDTRGKQRAVKQQEETFLTGAGTSKGGRALAQSLITGRLLL